MFKLKQYKHNKVANHFNKSLQLTTLIIGLSLVNSPAQARKPVPANVPQNVTTTAKEDGCVGQIANPAKLFLPLGKSTLIKLPEPLATRSIGNPEVVQAKLITPQTLYLLGLDIGSTNMIIQGKSGTCTIIDVTVSMDPDGLQQMLGELLPEEKNIKVTAAADSLILSGTVEDAITANRAVDIASAYVRRRVLPLNVGNDSANNNQNNQQNQQQNMTQQNTDMVNPRIVNMLSVSAQQQVMLEVKIAEVSKTLLDKLGVDFGDEKTAFPDFGVHLNYVGKKNWGAKVFYIKGNSNNAYHADLQKDSLISIRQLSDLDFRQKNKIIGFSANGKVAKTGNWKLSSVISRSDVENNWKIYNHEANNRLEDVIEMTKNHKLWSSMLSFSQRKENNIVKGGVFYESQFIDDKYIDALTYRKPKKTIDRMGFFFDVVYTDFDDKLKIQYGAHLDYFEETKQVINNSRTKLAPLKLSPRFAFSFSLNEKNTVGANVNYTRRGKLDNFAQFNISESNMNMLQWKHLFIKNAQLTVEVFYQRGKGISHDTLMTSNFGRGFSSQKSVNQGIATRFEQNFDNGSFVNANATWFRSTFQQEDKKWYSTKYDGKFASNLVYGKQWQRKRNTWGINSNLIFNGGQRDTPIDELNSDKLFPYSTAYLGSSFYTLQLKHYFRSDLRIYRTVKKKNYTATLSLDIQNVTNQQNVSFQYYDAIQKRIVSRYQTGLVPILNYRVAF